ncbi:putative ABC transporter permease [Bariatricus sp. HCP28S3_D3]|uniref:putative ABC transporter permease n=1 Tax=Bariatricus sp. HCP28S3_D3 TaxID=3438901 RepID=UPI003F88E8F7
MTELYFIALYFFVYGFLGWCTEVAFAAWKEHRFVNRGFLNGPICPVYGIGVTLVVHFLSPYRSNLIILYITSTILVTALEWLTGFILERVFHNKWWDYSNVPLNLNGYVCLLFSLIWGVACVLIVDFIHPVIHKLLLYIPVIVGVIILIILGIGMFADLYVTASGILKMNKRLAAMQEIADELHEISDKIGENIYKNTIAAMETQDAIKDSVTEKQEELKDSFTAKQEEFKDSLAAKQMEFKDSFALKQEEILGNLTERREEISETLDTVSDELKERIASLRKHYSELGEDFTGIQKRLLKAFPKMENKKYSESLDDLREKLNSLRKR